MARAQNPGREITDGAMLSAGANFTGSRRALWSDIVDGAEPDYSVEPFAETTARCANAMDVDYEPVMCSAVIAQGTAQDSSYAGGLAAAGPACADSCAAPQFPDSPQRTIRTPNKHAQSVHGTLGRGSERETDQHRLAMRQKQIDYGKNTTGYKRYRAQVPRHKRVRGRHPQTPQKDQMCSKRSWDGQMSKWRRALHAYDDPSTPQPSRVMEDC